MKRILGTVICLMLVLFTLCAGAESGYMVDAPKCGVTLFADGKAGEVPGRIITADPAETGDAEGMTEAVFAYTTKEDAAQADDGQAPSGSLITLFVIRGLQNGTEEQARAGLEKDIADGKMLEGLEIGKAGETTFYLFEAVPGAESLKEAYADRTEEELKTAGELIAEIAAHPEYFLFKNPGENTLAVRILDPDGQGVKGAFVNFCTDSMCMPKQTGADGRALMTGADKFHIQVIRVPEGMEAPAEDLYIGPESAQAEIRLTKAE